MNVLVAGASGVVGRRLLPLLLDAGHRVFGTTRSQLKADQITAAGAIALIVDVFDAAGLLRAVQTAAPQIVIHQLTDLPPGLDPARMVDAVPRNARLRIDGTRN